MTDIINTTNQQKPIMNDPNLLKSINTQLKNLVSETDTYTNTYRKELADKLYSIIKDISFDFNKESGANVKAKSELIRTFNEVLRDMESSKRENIKVQQKQSEITSESNKDDEIYLLLLKKLTQQLPEQQSLISNNPPNDLSDVNIGITSQETIEKELDEVIKEHKVKINDAELEKNPKKIDVDSFLD